MSRRARYRKQESSFQKGVGMGCGYGCVTIVGSVFALVLFALLMKWVVSQ